MYSLKACPLDFQGFNFSILDINFNSKAFKFSLLILTTLKNEGLHKI